MNDQQKIEALTEALVESTEWLGKSLERLRLWSASEEFHDQSTVAVLGNKAVVAAEELIDKLEEGGAE